MKNPRQTAPAFPAARERHAEKRSLAVSLVPSPLVPSPLVPSPLVPSPYSLLPVLAAPLLHRDRLGQIPRLIHVAAAAAGDVVGQQLQRDNHIGRAAGPEG